jgi:adenine-specific DNA-methyltransferase
MAIQKIQPSYKFNEEQLKQLRQIAPEAFKDNILDFNALYEALSDVLEEDDLETEHFGLSWPGKKKAKKTVSVPCKGSIIELKGSGIDEDNTKNVFIEGENLDALKLIQKSYGGQIKLIYIDPPYNKGQDYVYDDDYSETIEEYNKRIGAIDEQGKYLSTNNKASGRFHSKWLSMMFPRLKLAFNLLDDDGSIFISIDNDEFHNLRTLMDEVFGAENFVGVFIWRKKDGGGQTDEFFVTEHEYIVVYRKTSAFVWRDEEADNAIASFNREDSKGRYKLVKLAKWGTGARKEDRPTMHFPLTAPDGTEVLPVAPDGNPGRWRIGKEKMKKVIDNSLIQWEERSEGWIPYEKVYFDESKKKVIKSRSILYDIAGTGDGTNELTELFGAKDVFDNPKPTAILQEIITNNLEDGDIVLDFFAGSGSTGHAIYNILSESDVKVSFVLIQIPEKIKENKVAYGLGYRFISQVTAERLRLASKKLREDNPETNADLGFRFYRLASSNFKAWQNYAGNNVNQLETLFTQFESSLIDDWKPENLLTEILLIEGFPLDSKIEAVEAFNKNKVQKVTSDFCEHALFVCLDKKVEDETIKALSLGDNDIFICLDNAVTDQDKARLDDKGLIKTI